MNSKKKDKDGGGKQPAKEEEKEVGASFLLFSASNSENNNENEKKPQNLKVHPAHCTAQLVEFSPKDLSWSMSTFLTPEKLRSWHISRFNYHTVFQFVLIYQIHDSPRNISTPTEAGRF